MTYAVIGLAVALAICVIGCSLLYLRGGINPHVTVQDHDDSAAERLREHNDNLQSALNTQAELISTRHREHQAELANLKLEYEEKEKARDALFQLNQIESKAALAQLQQELRAEFAEQKRIEAKKTAERSRTALVAKIGEHFAPLLGGFPYNFKDARHVGELFDFLVFDGLEDGEIRQVVFLEVKTKASGPRVTNKRERMLRDAINAGRVTYDVFVPATNGAKGDV